MITCNVKRSNHQEAMNLNPLHYNNGSEELLAYGLHIWARKGE
jgi:hypothetical protein